MPEKQFENHYVYQSRWITARRTSKGDGQASYDSDEEDPSSKGFKLKERLLVHGRNKKVKHSTHPHPLLSYKILKEDKVFCTICEIDIIGLAYGCDQGCEFLIHKSCLNHPATIQHGAHPEHPLTLLSSPDQNADGMFCCGVCCDNGKGYRYHCSTCKYNVHVACAGLPVWVCCKEHHYPLPLSKKKPVNAKTINCNICHDAIILKGLIYYREDSGFVAHLDCAFTQGIQESVLGIQKVLLSLKVTT